MSQFLNFVACNGDKFSILSTGISYIHWGGIDDQGGLVPTDIYIFGKKRAIASIDHRKPENQRSLEKLIPVSWECQVFDEWEKN